MSGAHGSFQIDAANAEPSFHVDSDGSQLIKVADGELIAYVTGTPVEIADFCGRVMKAIRWDLERPKVSAERLAAMADDPASCVTRVGAPVPGDTQP